MGALKTGFFALFAIISLAACQTVKSSHCTAFDAIRPSQAQIEVKP